MAWFRFSLCVWLLAVGCPRGKLGGFETPPADGVEIRCPVTDARCTKDPTTEAAVYEMRTFYFCSEAARVRFAKTPKKFAYR